MRERIFHGILQRSLENKYLSDSCKNFIHKSGRFPFTSFGRINLAPLFAELSLQLLARDGRAGLIVPSGIATDSFNQYFFNHIIDNNYLISLYDFENREGIFPAVHRSYKFSLLTLHHPPFLPSPSGRGVGGEGPSPEFVFFATRVEHLKDKHRRFTLTAEDIARINPNTRTTPVFRTSYDAELTKKIYRRVPVLVNEKTGENPWGIKFQLMFMMNTDSHLFRTREQLQAAGYELKGNIFVRANSERRTGNRPLATRHSLLAEIYLPLYEAKMISQFDHRHGDYKNLSKRPFSRPLPSPSIKELHNPNFVTTPWYWVYLSDINRKIAEWPKLWFLGFRRITRAVDLYSCWFCFLPFVATIDTIPIITSKQTSILMALLCSNFNSLTVNYAARQKISGIHLDFFVVKQLPILPPEIYTSRHLLFAIPRILELTYTAWDLRPFADDLWAEADEELRSAIRKQWEENQTISPLPEGEGPGERGTTSPEWLEIIYSLNPDNPNQGACPLPPFKWDEERRARLRAELDAFFAKLYGLTEEELRYILDPQDVFGPDFPGETFRVLKEKETRQFGEYRTKRLILEAWERLGGV